MKYLKYLNPYYWVAVLFTWVDKQERKRQLIAGINEAERLNRETGAKVLVFNGKDCVSVVKKNMLTGKQRNKLKNKAFYSTK